jgi:hypothetical protein
MVAHCEEVPMKYDIRTTLPDGVKGFRYMGNTHYIEIVDKLGHTAKVNATGLVRYDCTKCDGMFFMVSNHGDLQCPTCGQIGSAKPTWVVPQLSFVPEEVSELEAGFDHEMKPKGV